MRLVVLPGEASIRGHGQLERRGPDLPWLHLVVPEPHVVGEELLGAEEVENNISASAAIGIDGTLKVSGGYSVAKDKGDLLFNLQHLDFRLFSPCLSGTFIPTVNKGTINIQGSYQPPRKEITGQVWVNDLAAGQQNGPYVGWQLATTDKATLSLDPLHLDLGEILVRKPVMVPGLVGTDIPLRNFFLPDKPDFTKIAIRRIHVEDGRFLLPWPIIVAGYQPWLGDLKGEISSLGQGAMPFSLRGEVEGLDGFRIEGNTDINGVGNYSLKMQEVNPAPLAAVFRKELGLTVGSALVTWE